MYRQFNYDLNWGSRSYVFAGSTEQALLTDFAWTQGCFDRAAVFILLLSSRNDLGVYVSPLFSTAKVQRINDPETTRIQKHVRLLNYWADLQGGSFVD